MGTQNRVGPKRLVVGAHYGTREWLAQRVTAVAVAVYTLLLLVLFFGAHNFSYEGWAGIFAMQWMKLATFVALLSLFYHAWVGMRDIWMDYVKPAGWRLTLQMITLCWLVGCLGWAVGVLWRL